MARQWKRYEESQDRQRTAPTLELEKTCDKNITNKNLVTLDNWLGEKEARIISCSQSGYKQKCGKHKENGKNEFRHVEIKRQWDI